MYPIITFITFETTFVNRIHTKGAIVGHHFTRQRILYELTVTIVLRADTVLSIYTKNTRCTNESGLTQIYARETSKNLI